MQNSLIFFHQAKQTIQAVWTKICHHRSPFLPKGVIKTWQSPVIACNTQITSPLCNNTTYLLVGTQSFTYFIEGRSLSRHNQRVGKMEHFLELKEVLRLWFLKLKRENTYVFVLLLYSFVLISSRKWCICKLINSIDLLTEIFQMIGPCPYVTWSHMVFNFYQMSFPVLKVEPVWW